MKIKNSKGETITVPAEFEQRVRDNINNPEYITTLAEQFKKGGMLKRKDGSYSRRGLWDNIRANRGSGKKPTKEMLEQERKIRAKHAAGGTVFKGYVTEQPMGDAVPFHHSTIGKKMAKGGETDDWKVSYDPNDPSLTEIIPRLSDKRKAKILQDFPNAKIEWVEPAQESSASAAPNLSEEELQALENSLVRKYAGQVTDDSQGRGYDYYSRLPEFRGILNTRLLNRMHDFLQVPGNKYVAPDSRENYYTNPEDVDKSLRFENQKLRLNSNLTPSMPSGYNETYGKGGYTVRRSSARKGKTHVVIGPDGTKKYFGDSKLGQHPGNPARKKSFYARHKHNLAKNPYFRAFARATWADGGKLTQNMYDLGIMPYADGGYTMGNMNPDGTIHVPYGYDTPAYNEREVMGLGGLFKKFKENKGFLGDLVNKPGRTLGDLSKGVGDTILSTAGSVTGIQALKDVIGKDDYKSGGLKGIDNVTSGIGDMAGTALKFIPVTAPFAGAASAVGGLADNAFGIDKKHYHPEWHQSGFEKATGAVKQLGDFASMVVNPGNAVGNMSKAAEIAGKVGQYANLGNMGLNIGQQASSGQGINPMQLLQMGMMANNTFGSPFGKMADGGQTGMVPINVEGANFSSGSGPNARKGELLVLNGKIIKNYVGRPPHPAEGQNPMGNDDAPEGLIVIPKNRTKEYLEAGLEKRKQLEKSLVSQQQDREMKRSRRMGDGGYYSFGMGDMGMGYGGNIVQAETGGPIGNPETIDSMMGYGYKKGGWIQKATASIKRRGTEGVCTGAKFGSSSCPPGSRRYNLAKTFRKMAKARKHEYGGFVDPVTGSHTVMYKEGGPTIHDFPMRRLRYDDQVVTGGNYTNVGEYNNFLDSTFQANNPTYPVPSNFITFPTDPVLPKFSTTVPRLAQPSNNVNPVPYDYSGSDYNNEYVTPRMAAPGNVRANRGFYDYSLDDQGTYAPAVTSPQQTPEVTYPPTYPNVPSYSDVMAGLDYNPNRAAQQPFSLFDPNKRLGSAGQSGGNSSYRVGLPSYLTPGGGYGDIYNAAAANVASQNTPPAGFKGVPYRLDYTDTPTGSSDKNKTSYLDPNVRRAMNAYGILGEAYGLAQMGEGFLSKPDRYKRMALNRQRPELLNPREALADERRTMAGYKYAGRQTGPNQRAFLTSLAAKDAAARSGIYGNYDDANAQIMNAYKDALVRDQMALMQQDQVAQMYDAKAKANRRNMIRSGASDIVGTAGTYANMLAQREYLNRISELG